MLGSGQGLRQSLIAEEEMGDASQSLPSILWGSVHSSMSAQSVLSARGLNGRHGDPLSCEHHSLDPCLSL